MTIFPLLVAVSEYPVGISDLPGCSHDLDAMLQFLREYAELNEVDFKPLVLRDEAATRQNVIAGFNHFEQAGPNDICLFYFSGHGALMDAPPELWRDEPSKQCQTMVLHDSRLPGGQDLVDKELSYLLATRAKNAGQLLVIADSCHSGTISRLASATPRTVSPAKSIIFDQLVGADEYLHEGGFRIPPHRDHITFSACQPQQVAVEMPVNGTPRGLFTYYLLETLNGSRISELSYAELTDRVRTRVKNHYRQQDIHVQASGQSQLDQLFFDGQLKRNRAYLLHQGTNGEWFFNQGSVQGIRARAQVRCLVDGEERDCTVTTVLAGRATVSPEDWMEQGKSDYPIVHVERGEPPLPLYFTTAVSQFVRGNLLVSVEDSQFPLIVTEQPDEAKYHITMLEGYGLSLVLPGEQRPLFETESSDKPGWDDRFLGRLAKVARYEATLALAPAERPLPLHGAVTITLEEIVLNADGEIAQIILLPTDGSAVLDYTEQDGEWYAPNVRLRITRNPDYPVNLHAGGLLMDESFGVSGAFTPVTELNDSKLALTTEFSEQEADGTNYYQDYLTIAIDDKLLEWGVTEIENHFKLFVSETPFDLAGHEQEALDVPKKIDPAQSRKVVRNRRRGQRHDRWATRTVSFRVNKPVVLDKKGRPLHGSRMQGAVEIASAPEGMNWDGLCLHSSLSLSRSLHPAAAPPCPTKGFGLTPGSAIATRSMDAPKDVLELTKVEHPEAVTPATPLLLHAPKLASDGCIALGYDEASRRYYPVGFPDAETGRMVIQQLPEPLAAPTGEGMINQRSLTGSVKLFFRKVINDHLPGEPLKINKLRKVAVTEDLRTEYLEPNDLKAEVVAADKPIALFIHGIIGDTTIAPTVLRRAKQQDGTPLLDHYGLVLTYDYENLHTKLPETAADLQRQLTDIGLPPGHGKTLHVFAHSMGGLVSRYFIERKRGHEVVSRLYQFGTPNGGSPFGTVAQYITPLLTWGLSAGAAYHPLLRPLLGLRWLAPKALVTLLQMKQGSDFLKDLKADGDRRGVPYTLINGDIRLIPDGGDAEANLLARLFARFDWRDAVDLALFRGPTDIAVSVGSQRDVPGLENIHEPVGCDHLSYFTDEAAIKLLEKLW